MDLRCHCLKVKNVYFNFFPILLIWYYLLWTRCLKKRWFKQISSREKYWMTRAYFEWFVLKKNGKFESKITTFNDRSDIFMAKWKVFKMKILSFYTLATFQKKNHWIPFQISKEFNSDVRQRYYKGVYLRHTSIYSCKYRHFLKH